MNDEIDFGKLSRWGIPGWISIVSLGIFILLDILFGDSSDLYQTIAPLFILTEEINPAIFALLVAAIGIPMGFIIYQAYFFLKWNSPFSKEGLMYPWFPGRDSDVNRILHGFDEKLTLNKDWRKTMLFGRLASIDHRSKSRYLEMFFTEVVQKLDSNNSVSIYSRYRYLYEVVHTLGASTIAIYLSIFIYTGLITLPETAINDLAQYALVGFIFVFILFYLLNKEDTEMYNLENDTRSSIDEPYIVVFPFKRINTSVVFPTGIYMYSLTVIILFINPAFTPNLTFWDTIIRLFLCVMAIVVWMRSKRNATESMRRGDLIFLSIPLIFSMTIRLIVYYFPGAINIYQLDWSFLLVIYFFLFANWILFRNRQNAKDELISLQRYTFNRYLDMNEIPQNLSESDETLAN